MTQLNNIRNSVKFSAMLDDLSTSAPIQCDKKTISKVICRGKNRIIAGQSFPIAGSCNCKTAGVAGYCSRHINCANIDDLLSEIRTDFRSRSITTRKRREIVKNTLYHRYMINMTNSEKTALIEAINCMADSGFSIEHGITSNKANISESTPSLFQGEIRHCFREGYLVEKDNLAQALVGLDDQVGSVPGLSAARDLLINYGHWNTQLPEIAAQVQIFIDIFANVHDEDVTPMINTLMFDTATAVIIDSCREVINRRNLNSLQQSVVPPPEVSRICPPLANTNSQEECPVCYEYNNMGKLPKCTHCVCKGCWEDWWETGNHTCPICRQTQD